MSNLTLDREEYDAALKVWQFLEDSGHLDCGSWSQDLAGNGTVTCSCGSQFSPCWLSTCCGKPVSAAGDVSQYWVCEGCERACDARPAESTAINYTVIPAGGAA
jgi:hypothetical protein